MWEYKECDTYTSWIQHCNIKDVLWTQQEYFRTLYFEQFKNLVANILFHADRWGCKKVLNECRKHIGRIQRKDKDAPIRTNPSKVWSFYGNSALIRNIRDICLPQYVLSLWEQGFRLACYSAFILYVLQWYLIMFIKYTWGAHVIQIPYDYISYWDLHCVLDVSLFPFISVKMPICYNVTHRVWEWGISLTTLFSVHVD